MSITEQTRRESHTEIKPEKFTRYTQILEILGDKEMTAREIEKIRSQTYEPKEIDMNNTRPRITELMKEYFEIKAIGKKKERNRNVTVFKKTTEDEKLILQNINHIPRID